MRFASALLLLWCLSPGPAAPIPRGLEAVPVGSVAEYLGERYTVTEATTRGGEQYCRVIGPDGAPLRPGLWVTASSVRAVIDRPDRCFFIYVDFGGE